MQIITGYQHKLVIQETLVTESHLLSELAANVTETFRSIKAHGLQTTITEHLRHLGILCITEHTRHLVQQQSSTTLQ